MEAPTTLLSIFYTAMIAENMALYFFLGICPLINLSRDLKTSFQMGLTVALVMVMTSVINFAVFHYLLRPLGLEYLQLLFFVMTIAAMVQIVEAVIDRFFPLVYSIFGIFLPLLTVNCAILGVSMFAILREYDLYSTLAFSSGSGIGWLLAICLMAMVKGRIDMKAVPKHLGETGVTMIVAAILAMAFTGAAELMGMGGF